MNSKLNDDMLTSAYNAGVSKGRIDGLILALEKCQNISRGFFLYGKNFTKGDPLGREAHNKGRGAGACAASMKEMLDKHEASH